VLGGLADALTQVPMSAGRDYRVLAISIDPNETPDDAARAHAEYGARYPQQIAGWHFLTGDPKTVRSLADAVGFPYRWDESIRQFAHPAGVTLVGSDGTVSRYLLGLSPTPLDLRLGLAEAGEGRIASPATSLLLLCFGYDPAAGRYDVSIMQATRLIGVATVGLLGLLIGGLVLAERRRR
jgi:protein SCO1/2